MIRELRLRINIGLIQIFSRCNSRLAVLETKGFGAEMACYAVAGQNRKLRKNPKNLGKSGL
jgi:hypothetical protein